MGFASASQYPSLDVRPGDVVANNYRVDAILSRERGMLLEARHTEFDQRVAVRLLTPIACSERDVEGFRREIRTLAKLESEHVARILDVGEHQDGSMFLVREHVVGSTLADAVVPGPMALPRAVDVILELGEAVQEAHSHGVVLRDLRPENVMLATRRGGESRAKLVDFGTAKLIGEQAGPEATMVLTGSPYASPELVRSVKDLDTRTDVWSLGCLLYLLLTGRAPFEGNGPQLMLAIAKGNPTPLSQLRPDLPRELDQIFGWALAKDRERRFSTVYALAHALRPFASTAGAVLVDRIGRLAEIAKTVDPEALAMQEAASRPARRLSRRGASEPPPSFAGYDARPSAPGSMPPPSTSGAHPSHTHVTQPPPPPWSYEEPSFENGLRSSYPPAYDDLPGASPSIPAVAASLPASARAEPKRLGPGMLAALCLALVIAPAATIGLMFEARGGFDSAAAAHVEAPAPERAAPPVAAATDDSPDAEKTAAVAEVEETKDTKAEDGAAKAAAAKDAEPEEETAQTASEPAAPAAAPAPAPNPAAAAAAIARARARADARRRAEERAASSEPKKSKSKKASSGGGGDGQVVALVLGGTCSLAIDGRSFGKSRSATMKVSAGSHTVSCDGMSKGVSVSPGGKGVATFRVK